MTSWTPLARAGTASGDEIILRQRGDVFEICDNGIELMSNLNHQSEDQLALRSMRRMNFEARRILIGGLGLGFTLRAVLDLAPPDAEVTVCELIPEIVEWNRGPLAHLAGHTLDDPRTRVLIGDVQAHLAAIDRAYDMILMDTDNGPSPWSGRRTRGFMRIAVSARWLGPSVRRAWSHSGRPPRLYGLSAGCRPSRGSGCATTFR